MRFSEEFRLGNRTLRDHAFTVTNGDVTRVRRLDRPSNIRWAITITPHSNADVTVVLPATTDCAADGAICTADNRPLSTPLELTFSVPSLTAHAADIPALHNGEPFTFELRFSEQFPLSFRTLRDEDAFTVTNGEVTRARRFTPGDNTRWRIRIGPDSNADVTIVIPVTVECTADGAICTADDRPLSNRLEFTVPGPE